MDVLELSELITLRKHCNGNSSTTGEDSIPEIQGSDVDYLKFYTNYLMANKPCLIKSVTTDWNSQKHWVCDNKPNFNYLKRKYGNAEVPVANCKEWYYNAHSKCSMNFEEFLEYWESYANFNYPNEMPSLYLKDWHFMNEFPDDNIYRVPYLFASDWMNEYLTNNSSSCDDYRFVYMGPKGTWTPLHADVFSSFSWSVNVTGKKKWVFFPPGVENTLRDKLGNLISDVSSQELLNSSKYPNYKYLKNEVILIQEVGDAVFVPSGWHHQVWNLDDTISINHNWVNACNIKYMWNILQKAFNDVTKEIEDCKDMENWEEHCQTVLKCSFGMNYIDFINFLLFIAKRRLENLHGSTSLSVYGDWQMGRNHMLYDLFSINPILNDLLLLKLPCIDEFSGPLSSVGKNISDLLNES